MPEPRTKLPQGLPLPLADFVSCKVDRLDLAAERLDWLPKPKNPLIPDAPPELSFAAGAGGTVAVTVGWGFVGITLTVSVVDGNLVAASDNPLLPRGDLDKWLNDLNTDLRGAGKAFDKVEVVDGKLRLTKRALAAAPSEAAGAVIPGALVTPKPGPQTAPSAAASSEPDVLGPRAPGAVRRFVQSWQGKAGMTAGALALGAAALFLFTGGDETPVGTSSSTSTTTTTTTTAAGSPGGSPGAGTEPGGSPGGEVGALPRCDEVYTDEEYAAVLEDIRPRLGENLPGVFPAVPAFADPGLHVPCDRWGDYFATDPMFPGIFGAGPGQVAVSHQGSVPDAVTGEVGLSLSRWGFPTNLPDGTEVFLATDCSGRTVTGRGEVSGSLAIGEGPIFQYGLCTVQRLWAVGERGETTFGGMPLPDFVVGQEEGALVDSYLDVPALLAGGPENDRASHLLDAAQVLQAAITGAAPANDSCFWFFNPDDSAALVRAADCADTRFWVFPLPGGPPGAIGSGGPVVAASGLGVTDGAVSHDGLGGLLFADTVFPCGPGRLALTVCPSGASGAPPGPWVVAHVVLTAPLPLEPELDSVVAVGFDLDGSAVSGDGFGAGDVGGVEIEYRLSASPDGGWLLERHDGGGTAARALVRVNAVTFVIPAAEVGGGVAGYRSYALIGGSGSAFPPTGLAPIAGPPVSLTVAVPDGAAGAATSTTAAGAETVAGFVEGFAAAIEADDIDFLTSRLHPLVIELFGEGACRAFVEGEILTLDGYRLAGEIAGPMVGLVGGREVPDYFTATTAFNYRGQPFETEASFALVDGEIRWFTECR